MGFYGIVALVWVYFYEPFESLYIGKESLSLTMTILRVLLERKIMLRGSRQMHLYVSMMLAEAGGKTHATNSKIVFLRIFIRFTTT